MESLKLLSWGSNEEKKGWKGLNNAAINSFNSNIINSFIREMFQNSNDARDKDLPTNKASGKLPPLRIVINYKEISQDQFPDFVGFMKVFNRIKIAPPNDKHVEFFKNAEKALENHKSIKLFIYEDYNTKGLSGTDEDDNSSFSGCVLSEGISVGKDKTAGGSYGIGKNAIFGFSKTRTVFYSSFNKNDEYIFQGIAKLATYVGEDGIKRSDRVFCGQGMDQRSIRNINELPQALQNIFKRTEPGLSQFAVCPADHLDWVEEFAKGILRNYWLLLDKGELVVELKDQDDLKLLIQQSTLEDLFKMYFNPASYEADDTIKPYGNPYEFYKCYKTATHASANLDIIGNVRFFFSELENNKTNAVAYLRNNMVVYSQSVHGFGSINYCGVFICDDEDGNGVLRDMEPPTHDSFSPERLIEKSEKYSQRDGQNILNGIKKIVRESLQTISDKYKKAAEDIPWLDDLLSSITGATGAGSGKRTNEISENETPEKIGKRLEVKIEMQTFKRNTIVNNTDGQEEGVGGGKASGTGGGPGGGNGGGGGGGQGGGPSGYNKSKKSKIKSRIFRTDHKTVTKGVEYFKYKAFLDSPNSISATDILISQKGDSGNVVCFNISGITDSNGRPISFLEEKNSNGDVSAYRIKSLVIPCELAIQITEPYKSSFKIIKG